MTRTSPVTAIVVTFNAEKWIAACLSSLLASTLPPQVIVIDNGSADTTVTIIEAEFPSVRLIKSKANLGFGKANNLGLREALEDGATAVFLLNQDAVVEPDAIKTLYELSGRHPNAGVISPLHLDYSGAKIDPHVTGYLSAAPGLIDDLFAGTTAETYELPFFPAAGWLIPKATIQAIGGFDPLFFMYGEDMDYCTRARRSGRPVLLAPTSRIRHWHGGPPKTEKPTRAEIAAEEYWQLVLWLKDPSSSFPKTVLCVLREEILKLLRHAIYLDGTRFFAVAQALVRIGFNGRQIHRHRKYCAAQQSRCFLSAS